MTKHFFIFLGTFIAGALIALTVRATRHHAPAAPAAAVSAAAAPHDHSSSTATSSAAPINTVCAICGMEVDPHLPTATYQGKTIGFGCKTCPAKFAADPDKYGPAYLRNEGAK